MKAYLYTWGRGRTTAEGEHIPTRIEQMEIHHIDGMLVSSKPFDTGGYIVSLFKNSLAIQQTCVAP